MGRYRAGFAHGTRSMTPTPRPAVLQLARPGMTMPGALKKKGGEREREKERERERAEKKGEGRKSKGRRQQCNAAQLRRKRSGRKAKKKKERTKYKRVCASLTSLKRKRAPLRGKAPLLRSQPFHLSNHSIFKESQKILSCTLCLLGGICIQHG